MTNAGVAEGIVYTDVAGGVQLGSDLQLRQQVEYKMIQSRKTSALWDIKKFAAEMGNAYRKMLTIHQEKESLQQHFGLPQT